jgi:hypothetical protein
VEPQTLRIELVNRLDEQTLEDFRRIYEGAFPAEERLPTDMVADGITRGMRLLVIGTRGQRLVAIAVFVPLTGEARGVQFLEYLAIDGSERGGETASTLLPMCLELLRTDEPGRLGIALEVEAPAAAESPEDRETRVRRIRFHRERNGAVPVPHAPGYLVPRPSGEGAPLHLELMWMPAGGPRQLRGPLLRACIEAILTQSYGLDPRSDLLTANLSTLLLATH